MCLEIKRMVSYMGVGIILFALAVFGFKKFGGSGGIASVSVPAPASYAGFGRLVLNENFINFQRRSNNVSYTGDNGVIWGIGLGFFDVGRADLIRWDGHNSLTLLSERGEGGSINTHIRNWPRGGRAGSLVFRYGYFEASMRLTGENAAPDNWVSFWLFSASHQETFPGPNKWSEIDIFESGFFPRYSAVVHSWQILKNGSNAVDNPGQNPSYSAWEVFPPNVNLNDWHVYAALWAPGYVEFYFDNKFMQRAKSSDINDSDECSILLSVHGNGKSEAQIRWVHVFQ